MQATTLDKKAIAANARNPFTNFHAPDNSGMMKKYSSNISREQFGPSLKSARKRTRPRTVDLCDVFCAALHSGGPTQGRIVIQPLLLAATSCPAAS